MNLIKGTTLVLLTILLVGILITLLMGGYMPLFSIALALLFAYYALIYFLTRMLTANKRNSYLLFLLLVLPLIWAVMDLEGFINFLLDGVHLDMK
jgi:EamA domain-containing membrane protein RarD